MLFALEKEAGKLHVFNVFEVDMSFPRKAQRIATIDLPERGTLSDLVYSSDVVLVARGKMLTAIGVLEIRSRGEVDKGMEPSYVWDSEGWEIGVTKSGIYSTDNFSLSERSHVAWKQELGLTRFANQDLPEALYGDNHLEILHRPSQIKISFSALEALRCWTLSDNEPIPHLSGAVPDAWDYTYTTDYYGSTTR